METGNSGIIGVTETRINVNEMKEYYRAEYKKIVDKEKKADSDLFHNKWKIRFGTFGARVGLLFQPNGTIKKISNLGLTAISYIAQKVMKWKNKHDKAKYKKQRDQLTADFINAEGEFKQFNVINPTTIEEIDDLEEKSKTR